MDEERQHIARLNAEALETKRRLDQLEKNDERQDADIRALSNAQEGTKTYVTVIRNDIQELKTQIFTALTAAQKSGQEERKDWQKLLLDVLKMTVGGMIAYLFTKGGG